MKKINTDNWKEFILSDLFSIKSPSSRTIKDYSKGETPYVSSGGINNGLVSYLEPQEGEELEKGNCISVSPLEGTPCFYQKVDFLGRGGAGSAITLLYNKNLNEYNALFICEIIKKSAKKFNYSNAFTSDNLKTLTIKLPAKNIDDNAKGQKYEPDWKYMENYMKSIEEKTQNRIDILSNVKGNHSLVDTSNFQSFIVENLFCIHPTRSYKMTNAALLDGGENPVLANSAYNNGIGGYSSQNNTEKGNIITFSDTVDANTIFYQETDFIGYSHVQGMYPINEYADKWSKYSMLYFASVFKARAKIKGFDYGNKFRRDVALKLDVLLPVNDEGKIDFEYMENYMRLIEAEAQERINTLQRFEQENK